MRSVLARTGERLLTTLMPAVTARAEVCTYRCNIIQPMCYNGRYYEKSCCRQYNCDLTCGPYVHKGYC